MNAQQIIQEPTFIDFLLKYWPMLSATVMSVLYVAKIHWNQRRNHKRLKRLEKHAGLDE